MTFLVTLARNGLVWGFGASREIYSVEKDLSVFASRIVALETNDPSILSLALRINGIIYAYIGESIERVELSFDFYNHGDNNLGMPFYLLQDNSKAAAMYKCLTNSDLHDYGCAYKMRFASSEEVMAIKDAIHSGRAYFPWLPDNVFWLSIFQSHFTA